MKHDERKLELLLQLVSAWILYSKLIKSLNLYTKRLFPVIHFEILISIQLI